MTFESKAYKWNTWTTLVNKSRGIWPKLAFELRYRISRKLANNIVVTGQAGIGKSYMAAQDARITEPRFKVKQINFTFLDYMDELTKNEGRYGLPTMFDEPSYAISHREWYKDVNQALVKTFESQRFMVRPLYIPVISISLLDRTIRQFLIQWQIHVYNRGRAIVYFLEASPFEDKIYRHEFCELQYGLMDRDKCAKDTCLGCDELDTCPIFRAQYERKKRDTQLERYEQGLELAKQRESQQFTVEQICDKIYPLREHYVKPSGKINVNKLRIILKEMVDIRVGHNKAYRIKDRLEYLYPNEFV